MATRYTIRYTDGTEVQVDRRPVHLMRAERLTTESTGANEGVLLMLWATATGGTGNMADFESWAETVDDWDRVEVDAVPPGPGSDASPT